jgi:hypothetical protein
MTGVIGRYSNESEMNWLFLMTADMTKVVPREKRP